MDSHSLLRKKRKEIPSLISRKSLFEQRANDRRKNVKDVQTLCDLKRE